LDGFFVVSSWLVDGELWCFDGRFSGVEDFPLFLDLFFVVLDR
jgi:hypothetical protein